MKSVKSLYILQRSSMIMIQPFHSQSYWRRTTCREREPSVPALLVQDLLYNVKGIVRLVIIVIFDIE